MTNREDHETPEAAAFDAGNEPEVELIGGADVLDPQFDIIPSTPEEDRLDEDRVRALRSGLEQYDLEDE
ncbi:hypothetical protein, partial [Leucobacter sp. M11]|uniref:hypothetical protein n=1 Tax=Leucobacter sp. M11 TaxID=2993565 RepID=UPI002D810ACA